MNVYQTVHPYSRTICKAVAEGLNAPLLEATDGLRPGSAVVYGLLRGCAEIVRHCGAVKRDFFHIDNGIFRAGHHDGFYRISRNGLQPALSGREYPSDRWAALDLTLEPWRKAGSYILIVPPSEFVCAWNHFDGGLWLKQVIAELRLHTDREIKVKGRQKGGLELALGDAWCCVTYNSMAACHALVAGVPSLTLAPGHVASSVAWNFENIESPVWADREPWAYACAYHQYRLDELAAGMWPYEREA